MKLKTNTVRTPLLELPSRSRADLYGQRSAILIVTQSCFFMQSPVSFAVHFPVSATMGTRVWQTTDAFGSETDSYPQQDWKTNMRCCK